MSLRPTITRRQAAYAAATVGVLTAVVMTGGVTSDAGSTSQERAAAVNHGPGRDDRAQGDRASRSVFRVRIVHTREEPDRTKLKDLPDLAPDKPKKPKPKKTPAPAVNEASSQLFEGTPEQIARQKIAFRLLGGNEAQFVCFKHIIDHESGWDVHADNPSSDAYGIPQALPGSKMASAGPDWQNNAETQIKWGLGYVDGRYGNACGAWEFWQANNWY